jgi:hypothetical protein
VDRRILSNVTDKNDQRKRKRGQETSSCATQLVEAQSSSAAEQKKSKRSERVRSVTLDEVNDDVSNVPLAASTRIPASTVVMNSTVDALALVAAGTFKSSEEHEVLKAVEESPVRAGAEEKKVVEESAVATGGEVVLEAVDVPAVDEVGNSEAGAEEVLEAKEVSHVAAEEQVEASKGGMSYTVPSKSVAPKTLRNATDKRAQISKLEEGWKLSQARRALLTPPSESSFLSVRNSSFSGSASTSGRSSANKGKRGKSKQEMVNLSTKKLLDLSLVSYSAASVPTSEDLVIYVAKGLFATLQNVRMLKFALKCLPRGTLLDHSVVEKVVVKIYREEYAGELATHDDLATIIEKVYIYIYTVET